MSPSAGHQRFPPYLAITGSPYPPPGRRREVTGDGRRTAGPDRNQPGTALRLAAARVTHGSGGPRAPRAGRDAEQVGRLRDGRLSREEPSFLGGTTTPGDPAPAEAEDQAYVDTRAPSSSTYGSSLWMADVVDVYPTIAGAVLDAEAARNPKALACLFRYWGPGLSGPNSDLGAGLGQGEVDSIPTVLDRTAPVMPGNDSDNEWSVHYTYHGTQGTIYVDWVTVQRGRSESVPWLSNLGSPVPDRLIAEMTAAAQHQLTGSGS